MHALGLIVSWIVFWTVVIVMLAVGVGMVYTYGPGWIGLGLAGLLVLGFTISEMLKARRERARVRRQVAQAIQQRYAAR